MDLKWMGDEWFGQDVDKLLAYQSPQVVKINDRKLGFLKNLLTLLIFVYIFVFNIWYKGSHFALSPVEGIAKMQWQEPTKKCNPLHIDCEANYQSTEDLPYCKQYKGKQPATFQKTCDFYDARELPINMLNGVLLPTLIAKYEQKRMCLQGSTTCSGKWKYIEENGALQVGTGYPHGGGVRFVADVEDFTLMIDHTFRTGNAEMRMDDYQMQGYFKNCNEDRDDCEDKPIKCVHSECEELGMLRQDDLTSFLNFAPRNQTLARQRLQSRRAAAEKLAVDPDKSINLAAQEAQQEAPQVIAITDGDIMSLKTLLALAGKTLDEVPDIQLKNADVDVPRSIRYRGIALVVTIRYENLQRWTLFRPSRPWYTITVTAMPAESFKLAGVQDVTQTSRAVKLSYGTMVLVTQSGNLAFFSPMVALISLTTAMALLAVSTTLTELLMLNVLPRKVEYQQLKFKESEDFNPASKAAEEAASP